MAVVGCEFQHLKSMEPSPHYTVCIYSLSMMLVEENKHHIAHWLDVIGCTKEKALLMAAPAKARWMRPFQHPSPAQVEEEISLCILLFV